jgi:hypothetical protein
MPCIIKLYIPSDNGLICFDTYSFSLLLIIYRNVILAGHILSFRKVAILAMTHLASSVSASINHIQSPPTIVLAIKAAKTHN